MILPTVLTPALIRTPLFIWDPGVVLGPILANFFKNLPASVTRYHGQLFLCTISEKTNNPILRKLSDGGTDGQTDRRTDEQTDESDFIERSPTKVWNPK